MTDNIIQFGQKHPTGGGADGFGELIGTVYLYENGHYVQFADPTLTSTDVEARRSLRDRMFTSLCYEAENVYELTGELPDMPVYFAMIFSNGRIVNWTGDHLESLAQMEWTASTLHGMGVDLLRSRAYKAYPDNDNPKEPTA